MVWLFNIIIFVYILCLMPSFLLNIFYMRFGCSRIRGNFRRFFSNNMSLGRILVCIGNNRHWYIGGSSNRRNLLGRMCYLGRSNQLSKKGTLLYFYRSLHKRLQQLNSCLLIDHNSILAYILNMIGHHQKVANRIEW